MKKILENIHSAEWWFTAFLVAIFASIFAGYIKDWIPKVSASFSRRMKRRYEARMKAEEAIAARVHQQPALAAVYGIKLIVNLGMFLMGAALCISGPVCYHFYTLHPELDFAPTSFLGPSGVKVLSGILALVTMFPAFRLPRAVSEYHIALEAADADS